MLDGGATVASRLSEGITPASFYVAPNAVIFEAIQRLARAGKPTDLVCVIEELRSTGRLNDAGGMTHLIAISGKSPTTAQAEYFADHIRLAHQLREVTRIAGAMAEAAYSYSGDGIGSVVDDYIKSLQAIANNQAFAVDPGEPATSYDWPDGDDPNILLGNDDFLSRGGGFLLVSHASAGKSSLVLDQCMFWALGRPAYGIKCNGPLKSLIVQSEDSRRYIGKIVRSFCEANQLNALERAQLAHNVVITKVKGIMGEQFFSRLRKLIALHKPDLVVINPAYLYAEGDISKAEYAQPFLVGLDALNKEEKFGYIIVHHTGKPERKDSKGNRAAVEDWESVYMGFGSSYFANWPRCSALLERRPGDEERYVLKLGKGRKNAGVTRIRNHEGVMRVEPTTQIPLRYSTQKKLINGKERGLVYWESDTYEEGAPVQRGGVREGAGRKAKYSFEDFRANLKIVCEGEDRRQGFNVLHRAARAALHIPAASFNDIVLKALGVGDLVKHADGKYYMPKV
jgi:hypothetical protein